MTRSEAHSAGVTFIAAARSAPGEIDSLRILGSRIVALNCAPHGDDLVVDLRGDRLVPGLVNSHDHLQLNTLPPLETNRSYFHAREWIAEVDTRRRTDGAFAARVAMSRDGRLLVGGLKNLLSGVTAVAHHDPAYPLLWHEGFPTSVVPNYGWSHSLYVEGDEEVRSSYGRTPADRPWIIHAAEGVDDAAGKEFDRLEALGCVQPNSLIVHGVALSKEQRLRLCRRGAGLIWCPSSNLRLFGRTAEVADLHRYGRVALGTDSRLSGARDLLSELRVAREASSFDDAALEAMVTRDAASLLRLTDRGTLRVGARADILVLPGGLPLTRATRADIRLVVLGGMARYADADYADMMRSRAHWADVTVDGSPKRLERSLAAAVSSAEVSEPGLELANLAWRAA
jgi:cytosine/adenosine deaminase-related metal-dependent hydrolase